MIDKFCIHYYDDETGAGLDAFSCDAEIESMIRPWAEQVVTESSREFPNMGENDESRMYVFSSDRAEQLREICDRFRSRFETPIEGVDNFYGHTYCGDFSGKDS
jgi:hypothetical protein